jgi:hypothetical protein
MVTVTMDLIAHHVPISKNYPPEYKGDYFNEAFTTILDDLIFSPRSVLSSHH